MENVICTKCKGKNIYIEEAEKTKKEFPKTLDEFVEDIYKPQPAIYRPTTWVCKDCGYSITR